MGTREKKTLGYKERCDEKRQVYRQQLEQIKVAGKSVVYADESGFRDDGYRRYGYAPLGIPVFDLISSQRTRSLHLLPHVLKIPSLRHGYLKEVAKPTISMIG